MLRPDRTVGTASRSESLPRYSFAVDRARSARICLWGAPRDQSLNLTVRPAIELSRDSWTRPIHSPAGPGAFVVIERWPAPVAAKRRWRQPWGADGARIHARLTATHLAGRPGAAATAAAPDRNPAGVAGLGPEGRKAPGAAALGADRFQPSRVRAASPRMARQTTALPEGASRWCDRHRLPGLEVGGSAGRGYAP